MSADSADDFATVRSILLALNASWEPAEAHGAFCGRACLSGAAALAQWTDELAADIDENDVLTREQLEQLRKFAATTLLQLEAGQMGFQLLLPDDTEPLALRAGALADWCHGFMQGLAAAGGADQGEAGDLLDDGNVGEILDDFSEITKATAGEAPGEAAENDFAELEEYVRVSAQLVYEETAGLRAARQPGGNA